MNRALTAVVVGASSGIGEALARQLAREGWRVALASRRVERLADIAAEIGNNAVVCALDLRDPEAARAGLSRLLEELEGVDLVVLSAGTGRPNPDYVWEPERETLTVNVMGFAAAAQAAMTYFLERGRGHLAGISSVARFRGSGVGAAYSASKAFVSVYLDGLRDLAAQSGADVAVTEICPGFVDTAMLQADKPFWVASPQTAAEQILIALRARKKCVYITRRWALAALLLRLLPRPGR